MKKTREELLEQKRNWYHQNLDKAKAISKKSREKHKERRKLDTKIWLEKNREYSKEYHKKYHQEWYRQNKGKRNLQNIEWQKNNPDKVRVIKENFKRNNPDITKKYLKDYQITLKGKYRTMKGSGLKRNYEVSLNLEQFEKIISQPCVYCGEKEKRIGIDRIDNTKGYTLENSAPCCTLCNMMKKTLSVDDFLKHINKISKHYNY